MIGLSLAKSVSVLRKALEENGADRSYVLTLPGRGRQFGATAEIVSPPKETRPDVMSDGETASEAAPPAISL
jgi:DNA-binding winged helix-turn-helix (wHTH) protein